MGPTPGHIINKWDFLVFNPGPAVSWSDPGGALKSDRQRWWPDRE